MINLIVIILIITLILNLSRLNPKDTTVWYGMDKG